MLWIAPSEKDIATDTLKMPLGAAADQFRPVLGLIFLRSAEAHFNQQRARSPLDLWESGRG